MSKPQPIRSVLKDTLSRLEIDASLKAYSIWRTWKEIVGETLALQTQPRSIRNRILFVDVSHPTWVQQLQFLKVELIEKLNAFLGEPLIQDIRFQVGKIPPASRSLSRPRPWSDQELHEATLRRIEALLQKVEDQEMKRTLRDLMTKGAKLERHREKFKKG